MSRAIRFTAAELEAVAEAAARTNAGPKRTALERLVSKMREAQKPAPATAADFVAVRAATFARLAEEILGERVFLPPNPTSAWWGRLQAALTQQGIDAAGARLALEHVATWARQPQDLQSLASRASRYLHAARTSERPWSPAPEPYDGEAAVTGRPPEFR